MSEGIDISPVNDFGLSQKSAERLTLLLESTFSDSQWIHQCEGEIVVFQFVQRPDRVVINGNFSGRANGKEFAIPFQRDYLISDNVSTSRWLQSPIVETFMIAFRTIYNEQDPAKNSEDWVARSEFEIASTLEAKINDMIGVPIEGARSIWRNSLIAGVALFLLATSIMTFYAFTHPHPKRQGDAALGRFVLSLLVGALFSGVPAGFAGVFLGLTFVRTEMENSVAGQSLLRLIGVKSVKGLRVVSVLGTITCLGVAANFARMLISSG